MRRLVGAGASVYESVAERSDGQYEHDLGVVAGDTAFIVETKASPLAEPFRDPDKALLRLQRAFRSDKGIQKGFEQGARLRRRLDAVKVVQLYHLDGTRAVELSPERLRQWFRICVTRDD